MHTSFITYSVFNSYLTQIGMLINFLPNCSLKIFPTNCVSNRHLSAALGEKRKRKNKLKEKQIVLLICKWLEYQSWINRDPSGWDLLINRDFFMTRTQIYILSNKSGKLLLIVYFLG